MKRILLSTLLLLSACGLSKAQLYKIDSLSFVQLDTLDAARVEADKKKHEARTQTSMTRISGAQITRAVAPFGTADLIKSLQMLPGVSSGSELMSGLYVRGGDGSDNLFLLDDVPMYQVSHVIGMFSSFNTDVIDDVDFYKGGFPARYGGRLSSVVDVGVKEGDFQNYHGSASIGLIDGHINLEGPIVKGKTSFIFGARRTWTDILKSIAMLFITNERNEEMAAASHYDFGDFNLKVTHKFAEDNKLSFSAYYGQDLLKALMKLGSDGLDLDLGYRLRWGNILGTLKWEKTWNEHLDMDASVWYTNYSSIMHFNTLLDTSSTDEEGQTTSVHLDMDEYNRSRIYDLGSNLNFYYKPDKRHNIRFGAGTIYHTYDPSRTASEKMKYNGETMVDNTDSEDKHYLGGEIAAYVEDEIKFGKNFTLNAGLRDVTFLVDGRAWNRLEPRLAAKMFVNDNFSLKGSFSTMNQFTHQVAATYLDLPTNLWMPSTANVKPMHAEQFVAGFLTKFPHNISVDVECFYKTLDHLYEYTGANSMLPKIDKWEDAFVEGRGRAYGAELSVEYKNEWLQSAVYYTLSKSERLFKDFYYDWYPDRNDNRHRLTLTASVRILKNLEAFAGWTYHTGNRFTGYTAMVQDSQGFEYRIFDSPNNYTLPDYHRLDVGLNWTKKYAKGREAGVNLSVYNAYNHVNAMFGFLESQPDGSVKGIAYGLIPIIPTISYSYKF